MVLTKINVIKKLSFNVIKAIINQKLIFSEYLFIKKTFFPKLLSILNKS